ncbi:tRNA pseudouridine(38-40) synthase TruA [Lichenibacterium dinghuense]|uniref:tRNA pseudouridine(38-40) synthase TruA n=1 Tax=Lichenibacterium dinghuense TaxID=2895977 RepID=UPI001F025CFD|nr:tRNA pseudouridine(38-40) synthase TruA [Lichenibacterium sp. 6Y81]
MFRYKLTIEYDGAGFVGWQRQANGPSIQGALETAAAPLGCPPGGMHGAGRTDSGVHATGQVAHLDLAKDYRTDSVRDAVNANLKPHRIAIRAAERVAGDFDARHSAVRRRYLYRIVNRRAPLALDAGQRWLVKPALDAEAMHAAAQGLLGMHDFTTFRDSECQAASPVRTLDGFTVERDGEAIEIRVWARSFLHRQVRSMVGSVAMVGLGRWSAADLRSALDARDRRRCGQVAPADGLYLTHVDYP